MPTPPNTFTTLVIEGLASPYSVRGLTQTLEPIEASAKLRRTINGTLLDLSAPQFRKYKSTISNTDQRIPAIDGIWPGMVLTIDCAAWLSYPVGGSPSRPVVPGSSFTEEGFVFYRPRLLVRVTAMNSQEDEYARDAQWSLELEEV
jgi:hypothetical protein